ncbi:GNAT family N-acetyltransferase [Bradyrhizobium sp. HKCCYLS1011]|uniref:GNAT family N-acetyltransferase n=1 Tax=Bradyrhizobium sp. HKCCYLS1011 TaxID=3420733 RepID=UPI003EBA7F4C
MDSSVSHSLAIDAFAVRLSDIGAVDLDQLHALSIGVGWPHRDEDWQFLRNVGDGIAASDEIGRVLGSAMWFPHGSGFATIGMVITSPRLQSLGAGELLMRRVLEQQQGRELRLNATRAARRLYLSLDFRPERTVFQCQGEARVPRQTHVVPPGAELRRLQQADLAAIVELDAQAFGVPRRALLAALVQESVGFGLFRVGRLNAFALCRRFGRGHVVGPVAASCDEDALAVVAPHVSDHEGRFLRLDTQLREGQFGTFLSQSGLRVFDTVLTMSLGRQSADPGSRSGGQPVTYALASHALG